MKKHDFWELDLSVSANELFVWLLNNWFTYLNITIVASNINQIDFFNKLFITTTNNNNVKQIIILYNKLLIYNLLIKQMSSYSASFQTGTLTEDGLDMWGIQRAEDGRYNHNSKIKIKWINRTFCCFWIITAGI